MAESKLEVVSKAIDLMGYTYRITSNRKRYPKKYIALITEIQTLCMNIYKCLIEANRIQLNIDKKERLELQTKAITYCDELSCFVELSMDFNLVDSDTVEYWQKKISDIKYMTIAWRTKDKTR